MRPGVLLRGSCRTWRWSPPASRSSTACFSSRAIRSCFGIPTRDGTSAPAKPSSAPAPCRAPIPIPSPGRQALVCLGMGCRCRGRRASIAPPDCTGVALFYAAAIAAGVWMWFRLHWALGGNFLVACAMAPLLLSTCNIHWLARPHVIGWIFLLWRRCLRPRRRRQALFVVRRCHRPMGQRACQLLPGAGDCCWCSPWRGSRLVSLQGGACSGGGGAAGSIPTAGISTATSSATSPIRELLARIGEFQTFDFHTAGAGADHRRRDPRHDRRHAGPDAEAPASLPAGPAVLGHGAALGPRPAAGRAAAAAHCQRGDQQPGTFWNVFRFLFDQCE